MTFVAEKFLPTGTYVVINVKHDLSIAYRDALGHTGNGGLTSGWGESIQWNITLLSQKKWIIESAFSGFSADLPIDVEEDDEIATKAAHEKPHQWVIKQRQEDPDTYLIYSPTATGLFWSLQSSQEGATPQLVGDSTDASTWWRFKTDSSPAPKVVHDYSTPLSVIRPTAHPHAEKHKVAITIPPGWLTTISAVSLGQCLNLIRIQRKVRGALEAQDLTSSWEAVGQVMTLDASASANSHPMHAVSDTATVLVLEFYHAKSNNTVTDPLRLAGKEEFASNLTICSALRPTDYRSFSDYETFYIFDGQGPALNAIATVHISVKVFVDLDDPGKPVPGTVQSGYDVHLDLPRPRFMDEYLDNYNIIFVVDDSGSMSGDKWRQVREALSQIGNEAMQYDADGVDICFLNSSVVGKRIKSQEELWDAYDQVQPSNGTPTGAKLNEILGGIISKLNGAINTSQYGQIKPVDIIVLTDGAPTDDPGAVIQAAARRLDQGKHHPNCVGIQFVQIGNDYGADRALQALCKGPVRNMVDTVPFVKRFTPERLKRVLLGALHPSIRAKI
ncbi:hypothetical protein D9613_011187 [Agrocybe pediades]|uniref:VWFA domain-containing protein n=1 Tax=Agrocybe pediades TaxID=84607 RepID=A0A8H4VM43_9AGAR|nr:hypothetical protein D9613_011187 [Agrocybe pediades]